MSGFVDDLSTAQTEALEAMWRKVETTGLLDEDKFWLAIGHEDADVFLLRFLRARRFEVDKAFTMLTECIDWQVSFGTHHLTVAQVADNYFFETNLMFFSRGRCKNGRPIAVIRVKVHDKNRRDLESLKRFCILQMQAGRRMVRGTDTFATLVFDMTDFGLINMDFDFVKFLIAAFEKYYPETLGVLLLLNAPFVFWGCWRMISPWLDKNVADKVKFVTTAELTQYIDPENILEEHGGLDKHKYTFTPLADDEHADLPCGVAKDEDFDRIMSEMNDARKQLVDIRKQLHAKQLDAEKLAELRKEFAHRKAHLSKTVKYRHPGFHFAPGHVASE
ncbi:hypothetical protein CAOG_04216 [Capsaspora owczarzaki ATCC 30864]|uniref:CRAL-TRIO domain-containing protein n=1 Tax=Capsaspora owczarzaki (strain ATCC 30864) TaxID=595528 RepID=A0A0D2WQT6_CAPO3|nr:hypothetical protein CAOG_04216 [Capsaspora owczarzaki ATCC 30864]KJE93423.1 hypothetical protein CAOG_004216 [Capsaspora owczarzaki ATCC 30864]|eukprot:XP_004348041.1 hypothetical protein CAOG_04216 [Capsaspora owczarzaki ATCC 30864]